MRQDLPAGRVLPPLFMAVAACASAWPAVPSAAPALALAVAFAAALRSGPVGFASALVGVAAAHLASGLPTRASLVAALGVALPAALGAAYLRAARFTPLVRAAGATLLVAGTAALATALQAPAPSGADLLAALPRLLVAAALPVAALRWIRPIEPEEARRGFYAAVVDALPAVVFMKDLDGRYTAVNRSFEAFLEQHRGKILGRTDRELFPDTLAERFEREDREVLAKEAVLELDEPVPRGAEQRYYHIAKFPLLGPGGRAIAVGGVATDITEAHRLTQALQESEARLRDVVEYSSNLFYVHTVEHVFTYVSPRSRHFFGCEPEEAMVHWTDFVPDPSSQARAMASTERAIATSTRQPAYEIQVRRRDGRSLWVEVNEAPVVRDGRTVAIVGALTDIDERRRAEQELRRAASLLEATLEASGEGILVVDLHGHIAHFNQRFVEMWQVRAEDLASGSDARLLDAARRLLVDPGGFRARVEAIYAKPAEDSFDVVHMRDGRILERYSRPQLLDTEVVGRVWSFRDVTARRRAEEELVRHRDHLAERVRERTEELADANRELESFCSTVAHDLRSPLRAIDGYSRILEAEARVQLDEAAAHSVVRIRAATSRMARLIDDLLELARVSRRPLVREEVDLGEIARSVIAELRAADPNRSVEVDVQAPLRAACDPRLIRSLVQNLLDNAWKFSRSRAVAHITVGVHHDDGEPVFFVRDDGVGFDMTYAARLFAPFERLHGAQEFGGTGIGLAIVQRIVQRHGGRIWAEAEVGNGATFYFTLAPRPPPGLAVDLG